MVGKGIALGGLAPARIRWDAGPGGESLDEIRWIFADRGC